MTTGFPFLEQHQWLVFHEKDNPDKQNPNSSLAYQDAFIRYVPQLNETNSDKPYGILHLYPLTMPAILLGGKDTRLPNLKAANQYLINQGYELTKRPHGGLAVVNDPGIINFGFVVDMPNERIPIDEAYEVMVDIVRHSLVPYDLTVESYEIPDSYCPGKYDLVVAGRKIGGIAQRRFKDGLAVAAYISVNGDQNLRAEELRDFYEIGEADESYPDIDPTSMTTIEELIDTPIQVAEYEEAILEVFRTYSYIEPGHFDDEYLQKFYHTTYERVKERSYKIQPPQLD